MLKNWLRGNDVDNADKNDNFGFNFYLNAFTEAQSSSLSVFTGETKDTIIKKLIGVATCRNPHVIFTVGNLAIVIREIFSDEVFSEFLLSLTINFFTRISITGDQQTLIKALAKELAFAEGSGSLVPNEIKERVASYQDIETILSDNHWLVTYVMITLFTMSVMINFELKNEHAG